MDKKMKMKKVILIGMLLFLAGTGVQAQVKIGGGDAPASGALLDLNGAYKGGLLLPNVAITDLGKIPAGFTERGGGDSAPDLAGMIVWSTDPVNQGLYLWDGEDWQALAGSVLPCSGAATAPTAVNIPAGPFANGESFDVSCTATEDGTTFFIWTVPSGLSITGGQGTKTVTVSGSQGTYNKSGFAVFAVNQCGLSGTADGGAGQITVAATLTTTDPPSTDIEILSGSTTELDGGTVSGGKCGSYSYQWQVFNSPNWVNIPGATAAVFQTPALTADTKYRRITTCGKETVTSGEVTVKIKTIAEPDNVTVTSSTVTCGNSTTLSYSGGTGSTFVWYSGSCGGTQVGTGNNLPVSPAVTTTYYGRWEKDASVSNCKQVTVTVNKIATSVGISGPSSVGVNTNATFSASNPGGVPNATYTWSATGATPASGAGSSFTCKWPTAASRAVTVSLTSGNICYSDAVKSVPVEVTANMSVSTHCYYTDKTTCSCSTGTPHAYNNATISAKAWANASGYTTWMSNTNNVQDATRDGYAVVAANAAMICY
jgi:hypothetical protein